MISHQILINTVFRQIHTQFEMTEQKATAGLLLLRVLFCKFFKVSNFDNRSIVSTKFDWCDVKMFYKAKNV